MRGMGEKEEREEEVKEGEGRREREGEWRRNVRSYTTSGCGQWRSSRKIL